MVDAGLFRRGQPVNYFGRERLRFHRAFPGGIWAGPDASDVTFSRQQILLVEKMADHKAAAAPLDDRGFGQQFVSECRGYFESRANVNNRNADHAVSGEQGVERQAGTGEERGSQVIAPHQIVRKKDDARGVAVSPLDGEAALIFEHRNPLSAQLARCDLNSWTG